MSDEGKRRLAAYHTLCSHYRRWLANSVRSELEYVNQRSDDELSRVLPKVWRVIATHLISEADQADRECMAVWQVPLDRLDEFVRVRTHPELETLMKEQFGLYWDTRFQNWTPDDPALPD